MKLLNVDSLSVSYSHIPTVKDISFSISPGEIVGLVGESGCGKSTLLRTLMMLMEENCQIDKGAVFFEETDLTKLSEKELRLLRGKDIVMIFQNAALSSNPLHKIGHQFYETITSHSGKMSKKECYAKAEDILKRSNREKRTPDTKVGVDEIMQELKKERQQGICLLVNELAYGKGSVAAPILDRDRNPVAAISVSTSANALSQPQREAELKKAIKITASRISGRLGYYPY